MNEMKKIVIIMVLALMGLAATAGGSNGGSLNERSLNERFYQAKLREMVYRLHITPEQQKKFEPMYRDYCEEMTALWAERKRPVKPSTSRDAAAISKRKMEMQQRAQGIRMKYIDKFATVLNVNQIDRFFEVESIIQKKLKERRDQARGQ